MDVAANKAYSHWLTAKQTDDFSAFRDSFAALIDFTRKAIDLREEKKETYYDTCLDDYEKGGSIAQLDGFFGALRERIVPLLERIVKDGKPIRSDFLSRCCPIRSRKRFHAICWKLRGCALTHWC